jgi:Protein of unknown function (DUF3489)
MPYPMLKSGEKQAEVIAMLRRPEGATVDEVDSATGLAASHGARRLLGNPKEEARAHPCLGQQHDNSASVPKRLATPSPNKEVQQIGPWDWVLVASGQ